MRTGVLDMLTDVTVSVGGNQVPCGKTGHFDIDTVVYSCDQTCSPPYLDQIDTWRSIPAVSGLALAHPERVPAGSQSQMFEAWWDRYSGGHPTLYGPTEPKPIEIYCQPSDGGVKDLDSGYKGLGMWIPLASARDVAWARSAVADLVDSQYDWSVSGQNFWGAAYFGAYFSTFAIRAIGTATGLLDPRTWTGEIFDDGFESGGFSEWGAFSP